jgi:DNA-binding transcriptional ArsR family regulator
VTAPEPLPLPGRGARANPPRRQATEDEARTLASAVRLRILRLCLGEELTNKEIAERLDRDPASVLHHVRRLVDTGFLEALPARRGARGAREIPYRATGKSWKLSIGDEAEPARGTGAMLDAFLDELAQSGGELADASRLGLRLRPEHHEEFRRRVGEVLDEFAGRPPDPDGEWFSVFFAMHPDRRGTGG